MVPLGSIGASSEDRSTGLLAVGERRGPRNWPCAPKSSPSGGNCVNSSTPLAPPLAKVRFTAGWLWVGCAPLAAAAADNNWSGVKGDSILVGNALISGND